MYTRSCYQQRQFYFFLSHSDLGALEAAGVLTVSLHFCDCRISQESGHSSRGRGQGSDQGCTAGEMSVKLMHDGRGTMLLVGTLGIGVAQGVRSSSVSGVC